MKKLISAIMTAAIIVTSVPMISYANESTDIMSEYTSIVSEYDAGKRFIGGVILTEDSDEVMIDDMTVSCDEKVTTVDGTVMVPIDSLCDHITATYIPANERSSYSKIEYENSVVWFNDTSGVINTCVDGEDNIEVLDETPYKTDDTVMVPLESFADALGYEVKESNQDGTHYLLTQPYQTARLLVSTNKRNINTEGALASVRDEKNDITVLQYNTAEEAKSAMESLAETKGVTNVEPDCIMSTDMFAGLNQSSGELDTTAGHRDEGASEAIHVDDMLEPLKNEKLNNITVGVIDSGVCSTHEALKDRTICADVDFSSDGQESSEDNNGHGTHVTGILLDNTLDNVKVLAVKALNGEGKGTDYQIYQAMQYAVNNGAKLLNMSLGRYGKSDLLTEYVQELWNKNISVVVAAGNEHWFADEFTPGGIVECITVAAVDNDVAYNLTGRFTNGGYPTDCYAPGLNIYSTWIYDDNFKGYRECTGTSMSSPFCAAAVANMYSYDSEYTAQYIHDRIRSECQPFLSGKYVHHEYKDWVMGVLDCRSLIDFNRTAMPTVSTYPDYLTETQMNTITCEDENAEIYYTTDGSRASKENGTLYTEPIAVDKTMRLHVIAYCEGKEQSYQEYYDYIMVVTPDESKFTINNYGVITSFDYTIGEDKYLRVPDMIKGRYVFGIGDNVFKDNDDLVTIFLPEICYSIGDYAFYDCDALGKVNGKGVEYVGKYAFCNANTGGNNNNSEDEIILGELRKIGAFAFRETYGYKSLVSERLTEIPESAFERCGIEYLYAPNVTSIGKNAFKDDHGFSMNFEFPKVTEIGYHAFENCRVHYIELPKLTDASGLGEGVFYNSSLYSIDLPNLEGEIPRDTFFKTQLRTVNLPKVTSVEVGAFDECENLKELVLENVKEFKSNLWTDIHIKGVGYDYGNIERVSMPNCESFTGQIWSYYLRELDLPKCKTLRSVCSNSLKYVYLPNLEYMDEYTSNKKTFGFKCPNLLYAYLPKLKSISGNEEATHSIFLDCFNLEKIDLPSLDFDSYKPEGKRKLINTISNYSDEDKCKLKIVNAPYYADKKALGIYGHGFLDGKIPSFKILEDLPSTQSGGDLSIDVSGYNISYQWYYSKDNTNFEPIKGAVNESFSPSKPGYYCVDVIQSNYTQSGTKRSSVCNYTDERVVNPSVNLTVTAQNEFLVSADNYTYTAEKNGETYSINVSVPKGELVTVDYLNDDFEAWINDKNRTVSDKANYTFRIAGDTVINCVSKNAGVVSFYNANGDLISSKKFTKFTSNSFPAAPTLYGHTFTGWDKTAEEIDEAVKAGKSVKVTAQYKKNLTYYSLVLNGGEVVDTSSDDYNGEMSFREFSTVTVKASFETPIFRYWVDGNGNIVSYRSEYKFYMSNNLELTAVYGITPVIKQPIIKITKVFEDAENKRLVFTSERDIPDNYTVLEHGILLSRDNEVLRGRIPLTLDYDGTLIKCTSNTKNNVGTYLASKKIVDEVRTWGAVAYVIYQKPNGEVKTLYSDLVKKKYLTDNI